MIIRCRKCFKKYDDIDGECPRCGKINDRDFNKKAGKYRTRDKINTDVLENVGKLMISKSINIGRLLVRKFIDTENCEFCGADSNTSFGQCPVCMNSNLSRIDDEAREDFPNKKLLFEAVESAIDSSKKVVDLQAFKKNIKDKGFKFENWKTPYEGRFGITYNLKTLLAKFTGIAFLILLYFNASLGFTSSGLVASLIILIIVIGVVLVLKERMFSEKIKIHHTSYMDAYEISLLKKGDRQEVTLYEIKTSDIKYLEMEVDITTKELKSIEITANKDSDIKQSKFRIDVSRYHNKKGLKLAIMFVCLIKNIDTYISKTSEVIEETLESEKDDLLFVRIDSKVEGQVLSEEEYEAHISYLQKISSERYFKGGSFNDGGMIVFEAKNFETADDISKNDPIILNKKYTYQLKQWKVLLESE